jgi:two-component system chemotaxis response regulator CheB
VVVVGASAGGVEGLSGFVAGLDRDLAATVLIVLHFPPTSPSMLPAILSRVSSLPVSAAEEREFMVPGRVLVARPDHHLVVVDGETTLTRGPRENGMRPAVDVLFRSAARVCGSRVIGVVLSGALDDGTAGMLTIRQRGGLVLAQSPEEATYPSMPASVIRNVGADRVGTIAELAAAVNELVRSSEGRTAPTEEPALLTEEVEIAEMHDDAFTSLDRPGRPSGFSCPDCHGSLFEIDDSGLLRFRCRVGHAWSSLALMSAQSDALEEALWMAFRSLEEKVALSHQLADRAGERGNTLIRDRYLAKAAGARRSAAVLQELLSKPLSGLSNDDQAEDENVEQG